ncbi:unnamed protein product [Rotaria sordida]|uniref:Uncharacterized protein n=1 Tax=Rotaria sordida TaxID=392033 RepID=A0A815CPQ8_9BILA|nr:unnamed protein product [Rotaria sordida]
MTREETLINAGFRKRTTYENADVYKIFSILYGLVVFIGGVAFSISHAIVSREEAEIIKYLTDIYFTYLYWVSIIWIVFCIIDISRHQGKVKIPRNTLNRLDSKQTSLTGDARLARNKFISTSSEANQKLSITSYINLHLFDEPEKDELDDNDNEQSKINDNKLSTDNNDTFSFRNHHNKLNSLDNLSHRSLVTQSPTDTTRDIFTRRRALDPNEQHNLKTYIHHRKNSIVQHVIGYNYDDNSIVGGLYTRVGIGIFCLGTVIHSSLSILSNLENRSCIRWTTVIDDFSRLLFSLTQFFFIFKHSNLIIRAHENVARLAVIHIVVTNLCVCAFAIISNLNSSTWIIYVKVAIIILEFIEGTVHALFILIALRKRQRQTNIYEYSAREMIILLIMLDLSLWFEKTTTTTKHEANPFQLAFYHVIPWSIIAAIATPLQILFRFHASVCLSHVWANMYSLPTYEPVTPRDF